jgi:hypothetical protein
MGISGGDYRVYWRGTDDRAATRAGEYDAACGIVGGMGGIADGIRCDRVSGFDDCGQAATRESTIGHLQHGTNGIGHTSIFLRWLGRSRTIDRIQNGIQRNLAIMTIDLPGYQAIEKFYESSRSKIYRAIRSADLLPVILKISDRDSRSPQNLDRFQLEYEILRSLNIEGVITAYGLETDREKSIIILEDY